jgi:cell division initiation protein
VQEKKPIRRNSTKVIKGGLLMTITPMDIQNKEFERSFRGYDIEDVDEFLDRVAKDIEGLMRENMELKDQINQLLEKNKNYQKLEETMHNAIVVAQETAEEVKHSAKREADLIRREAESEAKRIIDDARNRSSKIMSEQEELFKQAQIFKMRFRSFVEAQLATLEREDWLDDSKLDYAKTEPRRSFEPQPDYEPKPVFEPKNDFEPEAEFEARGDFVSEIEPEFESKVEFEAASDYDAKPVIEPEPEPEFRSTLDHDYETDPEF